MKRKYLTECLFFVKLAIFYKNVKIPRFTSMSTGPKFYYWSTMSTKLWLCSCILASEEFSLSLTKVSDRVTGDKMLLDCFHAGEDLPT